MYGFSKANLGRKWWAIKGESARTGFRNPVWPIKRPSSRSRKTFRPIILGVNAAKDTVLLSYLPRPSPGPGYMHFNGDWDLPAFEQLTAERIEIEGEGAAKTRRWVPIPGRANERLDCRIYALAALRGLMHMGLKLNREADRVGAEKTEIVEADPAQPDPPGPDAHRPAEPAPALPATSAASTPVPTAAPAPVPPPAGAPRARRSGISSRLA